MSLLREMMGVLAAQSATPPLPVFPTPWLKLDPNTGVTVTSGKVSAVNVGGGYTAAQATDSLRPTLATVNGFPVFRFASSGLTIPSLPLGDFAIFIVIKATALGYIMEHGPNAGANPGHYTVLVHVAPNYQLLVNRGGLTSGITYSGDNPIGAGMRVVCHRYGETDSAGRQQQLYINDTTPESIASGGASASTVTANLNIGFAGDGSYPITGDIPLMEIYPSLTDAEVAQRMTELMTTYSTF